MTLWKKSEQVEVGSGDDGEGTAIVQVIFVCSRAQDAVNDVMMMNLGSLSVDKVLS